MPIADSYRVTERVLEGGDMWSAEEGLKWRSRPFNLEEEISKRRFAEPRVSTNLVRLQYGGDG